MRLILFLFLIVSVIQAGGSTLPMVIMETEAGEIVLEIDTVHAPVTAKNFLDHALSGTFENAVFYRVVRMDNQPQNKIRIEVIQGGLFDESRLQEMQPIRHESTRETGLMHLNGTLSMARAEPGTASTEFFICIGDQPELDYGGKRNPDGKGFAAFGRVVRGMNVVRDIQMSEDKNQYLVEKIKISGVKVIR